ncbi:4'-phosphopantetheinyl transferase family protein [Paraburkholderia fungorum]|uniref:4'-phosphopantetheinyl transferase family protein n=1 Tax=Paraburkholderia fungorum TaxID=134537 RepID=UPI0038B7E3D8
MHFVEPVPLPQDVPSDIALWRIDFAAGAALDDAAFASLSEDERARARGFRHHADALRFVSVRAALREQLAQALGIAAHAVRFALDANRRPHLVDADGDAPDFNVSHAGAHGLIAMSSVRRVGVDIEQHSDKFDWRSIASLTLAESEAAWLEGLGRAEQFTAFYEVWVAKEALVKTTGVGITRGLQKLTVLPRDGAQVRLRDHVPDDMRDLAGRWLAAPDAYAACLAWSVSGIAR